MNNQSGFGNYFNQTKKSTSSSIQAAHKLYHEKNYRHQKSGREFSSLSDLVKNCNLSDGEAIIVADQVSPNDIKSVVIRREKGNYLMSVDSGEEKPFNI